jgi:hypothetical protein
MRAEGQWTLAMGAVALGKVALALALFLVGALTAHPDTTVTLPWVSLAAVLAYGVTGATLLIGGRLDGRCRELGVFFLLVASPFADVVAHAGIQGPLTHVVVKLRADAFMPVFLWLFVRDFPVRATLGWSVMLPARAARLSLVFGILLVVANLIHDTSSAHRVPALAAWAASLSRDSGPPLFLYWQVLFVLMLPAAPVLLARSRNVGPGHRRRVVVFLSLMLAGLVPLAADVVLRATSDAWSTLVTDSAVGRVVSTIVLGAFLSTPFITAYAVVVARVADLRVVIRQGMQHALARYTVLSLVFLPLTVLAWWIYANRAVTIESLIFGRLTGPLLVATLFAAVALSLRTRFLTAIDRRFFREQYDAHRILTSLVDIARRAGSSDQFVDLLTSEIDRALHPDRIAILIHDELRGVLRARDGHTRPLATGSVLMQLLGRSDDPLEIDPDDSRSVFARLDDAEQSWLVDGGFRLLVPFRGSDGSVGGLLALGEKKSELPYSSSYRKLLAAVGVSGGLFLERRREQTPTPPHRFVSAGPVPVSAMECITCGLVVDGRAAGCECGGPLREARVPKVLAQKFRIERRIGAGGMGIVYRGSDLGLGRQVAIKTLPGEGANDTWRLRREARAMAFVSHQNLAMIYGLESWRGTPLLIEEYLVGGTLADRLTAGPRPLPEVIDMGLVLSRVLQAIHAVGLMHRDIKPSNIGFSADGTVKLLDFGLAQMMATAAPDGGAATGDDLTTQSGGALAGAGTRLLGTPAYMSPEAIRGEPPAASFDLWGLTVVLFEALSGVNPFKGATLAETVARIERHRAEPLGATLPGGRSDVAEFFASALSGDRRQRPVSAVEFTKRLSALSLSGMIV